MVLALDVSRVVKNPRLQQPFRIQRNTYIFADEGEWKLANTDFLTAVGVVTPTQEKDRAQYLSEAQRQLNAITIYSPTEIRKADGESQESDIVIWRGGYYRVEFSKPFDPYGYWFAIATGFVPPADSVIGPPTGGTVTRYNLSPTSDPKVWTLPVVFTPNAMVFRDGLLLAPIADYTTSGTSIAFVIAPTAGANLAVLQ